MTAFEENHPHLTAVLGGLTAGLVFTTGFAPLSWTWASFAALAGWFFLRRQQRRPKKFPLPVRQDRCFLWQAVLRLLNGFAPK